jgi:hypothetical protein
MPGFQRLPGDSNLRVSVNFETAHQNAELARHFRKILGCGLRVANIRHSGAKYH